MAQPSFLAAFFASELPAFSPPAGLAPGSFLPVSFLPGSFFPDSSFLDGPYRSAYQPPPLSWKAVRDTTLASRVPPHPGHLAGGGSDVFCITSVIRPHFPQRYS